MTDFYERRIERTTTGGYQVRLPEQERALLGALADQLRDVLMITTDDPAVRRLFPTAYNEDAGRDQEYQQLVRDELLERRLAALGTVEETLAAEELTEDQLSGWLRSINDVRLVLGTRLDVGEEPVDIDPDDPDAAVHAVYDYLGFLLNEVVDALTDGLPEPPDDEG